MYILTGGGIFQVEAIPTQITTGLKATTVSVSIESVSLQLNDSSQNITNLLDYLLMKISFIYLYFFFVA